MMMTRYSVLFLDPLAYIVYRRNDYLRCWRRLTSLYGVCLQLGSDDVIMYDPVFAVLLAEN